ncbi:MAG: molybdenum cofactor guanylyltransferase [Alphaproteobacteria bacterium]|nr:molybdenum cofactor guanylyltransferase [Alphaproteobacteria bacterium]
MQRLGAILAGGTGRRFGSDKALALLGDKPLIAHVAARLGPQVESLVVCGRDWDGLPRLDDRPRAGLGPLGGLCAALTHAEALGMDAVLTAPVDAPTLPRDIAALLARGRAPAVLAGQPLIGLWPSALATPLARYLADTSDLSVQRWVTTVGARRVRGPILPNINTPNDMAVLAAAL